MSQSEAGLALFAFCLFSIGAGVWCLWSVWSRSSRFLEHRRSRATKLRFGDRGATVVYTIRGVLLILLGLFMLFVLLRDLLKG